MNKALRVFALLLPIIATGCQRATPSPDHPSTADFTEANFDTEVLNAPSLVVVDFTATWCGPCRRMKPHIHELATEYQGRVKIGALDVDDSPGIAKRYDVNAFPTLLFFRNGEIVHRLVGYQSKDRLQAAINSVN